MTSKAPKDKAPMEDDIEVEFHTTDQYILGATNMILALSEIDPMTRDEKERKERIINRCIKIFDLLSKEYHDELFTEE